LVHQLRDICSYLKDDKDVAFELLRRKSRELVDRRDEVKTIKMVHRQSQGHFCQVVESVSAYLSQSKLMRLVPERIPREAAQEERDRSLGSLVAFLDDVKRESRRSPRHYHHRRD
jgi:hypothetical protein